MSTDGHEHDLGERPGLDVGLLTRLPGGHSRLTYRLELAAYRKPADAASYEGGRA